MTNIDLLQTITLLKVKRDNVLILRKMWCGIILRYLKKNY